MIILSEFSGDSPVYGFISDLDMFFCSLIMSYCCVSALVLASPIIGVQESCLHRQSLYMRGYLSDAWAQPVAGWQCSPDAASAAAQGAAATAAAACIAAAAHGIA